jgi:ammonia channel protein AmtB
MALKLLRQGMPRVVCATAGIMLGGLIAVTPSKALMRMTAMDLKVSQILPRTLQMPW